MSSNTPYAIASKAILEPKHFRLSIEVKRDVKHFSGLAAVIDGFQSLDGLLRSELDDAKTVSLDNSLLEARAQLLKFRVNSDPVAELVANHGWLAVLAVAVVVVRDYERFRSSAGKMKDDAAAFIHAIRGLTQHQKEQVVMGSHLLVDELLTLSEQSLRSWAARLARVRRSLGGPDGEPPTVTVERGDA